MRDLDRIIVENARAEVHAIRNHHHKEEFLDDAGDIDWLFETHLKDIAEERSLYNSAIIFGNADAPVGIWLYKSVCPLYDQDADKKIYPTRETEPEEDDIKF